MTPIKGTFVLMLMKIAVGALLHGLFTCVLLSLYLIITFLDIYNCYCTFTLFLTLLILLPFPSPLLPCYFPTCYFPVTSLLLLCHFPFTCLLIPNYFPGNSSPITSLLLPCYFPLTSLFLPCYFPVTSLLLPCYFPVTYLLLACFTFSLLLTSTSSVDKIGCCVLVNFTSLLL